MAAIGAGVGGFLALPMKGGTRAEEEEGQIQGQGKGQGQRG